LSFVCLKIIKILKQITFYNRWHAIRKRQTTTALKFQEKAYTIPWGCQSGETSPTCLSVPLSQTDHLT